MSDIARLPSGWKETTLAELGLGRTEGIFPADSTEEIFELWSVPAFPTGKPEILAGSEIGSNKQRVQPGDILLCKINPRINRVWKVGQKTKYAQIASTEWIVLRVPEIEPDFLVYRFREQGFRDALCADVSGVGGSLIRARPQSVEKLPITLPPLNEQRRIVAKIEALKARSQRVKEALEAIPPLLDQFRQSVLAAAFRGDLTADWRKKNPDVEPASVLLERIRRDHRQNKALEEIELATLPELPENWCWATLGEVSAIQGGIQKQPKRVPNKNAYPFLRVANVPRGRLDLDNVHRIELFGNELEKLRLYKGDLLIVEGNGSPSEIGRMAIWDGSIKDCVHQNHLIRVRLDKEITPEFVEAYWNAPQGRFRVFDVAHTTTGLYTLSVSKIAKLPVPLAPKAEQVALMQILKKLFKIETYVQATIMQSEEELDSLDQSILAKAFRGELVPQDPNDEPASVLLERIRAEREKADKTKKANGKGIGKGSRKAKAEVAASEQLSMPGLE